jgi:hypothetical protein
VDFGRSDAHTVIVLRFRKPPRSFICFLLLVVALGAASGYLIDALGVAAFCFFVASIDAKPAWKFWYDPAKDANGRSTMARAAEFGQRAVPSKRSGEDGWNRGWRPHHPGR